MKKTLICLLFAAVLITSCGRTEQADYGEQYVPDRDCQKFSGMHDAVCTDQGFYVINSDERIDFVDRETGKSVPLCNKPNCSHEGESCNAYFDAPVYIGVYDGYLYVVAVEYGEKINRVLYRVSMDGSERKKIRELFSEEEGDASLSLDFAIHRGSAYMITNWVEPSRKEREQVWYRLSLEEGEEEKEELYRIKGYSPLIWMTAFDANHIYYSTSYWKDSDLSQKVEQTFRFDIRTDEVTEIDIPEGDFMVTAVQGKVYYASDSQDKTSLFCMGADGQEAEQIYEWQHPELPEDGAVVIYKDRRFLFLESERVDEESADPPRSCVIIDYGGQEVLRLGEDDMAGKTLYWSNSEQLLLLDYVKGGYQLIDL